MLIASAHRPVLKALPLVPPGRAGHNLWGNVNHLHQASVHPPGFPGSLGRVADAPNTLACSASLSASHLVWGVGGGGCLMRSLLWDLVIQDHPHSHCTKRMKCLPHPKALWTSNPDLPISSEIFKPLIQTCSSISPPCPSGIPLGPCSKYLLAPEEIRL